MKINKLIIAAIIFSVALPAAAASAKNPVNRKKARKPAVVKPAEAPHPAPTKVSEADPTTSWQAYSFP